MRSDSHLHGVEIGGLGIIDPLHPIKLTDKFTSVHGWSVAGDGCRHACEIDMEGHADAQCRHDVFGVVNAVQVCGILINDWDAAEMDRCVL